MGIPGLSQFMSKNSEELTEEFELHDTSIVIDGPNIACRIYFKSSCDFFCGGDYENYSRHVNNFFDRLHLCNVTPIVIMDGSRDVEKISKFLEDMKRHIHLISNLGSYKYIKIFPIAVYETFVQIAQSKNIKCFQSLSAADNEIAFVARIYNCPVLSCDSDFYIFDVPFIHFETFQLIKLMKKDTDDSPVMAQNCRIFKRDNILRRYPGMHRDALPLLAIFLGNDYVLKNEFSSSCSLVLKNHHNKIDIIENIFEWLQNHSLNSAISEILSNYNKEQYSMRISSIEIVITKYLLLSCTFLDSLGFSEGEISEILKVYSDEPFKFDTSELVKYINVDDILLDEINLKCDYLSKKCKEIETIFSITPKWFIDRYRLAKIAGYWLNVINKLPIYLTVQVSDMSRPGCGIIGFPIMSSIFKIITTGTSDQEKLYVLAKGYSNKIEEFILDSSDLNLPPLASIECMSREKREKVFNDIFGVTREFLNNFPREWQTFMATIKYWQYKADKIFTTDIHLSALVLIFLFNIAKNFDINLNSEMKENIAVTSIDNILCDIKVNECKIMMNFFKQHMFVDRKNLDVTVIHSFALFHNLLRNSMHLNALLMYPYPDIYLYKFYNSSMIVNMYNTLKKNSYNLELYLEEDVFGGASNFLRLFFVILNTFNRKR